MYQWTQELILQTVHTIPQHVLQSATLLLFKRTLQRKRSVLWDGLAVGKVSLVFEYATVSWGRADQEFSG